MVFGTQLYEIWKPAFNVESYIFFMHFEPTPYFVLRLAPLGLQVNSIYESMSARADTELLKNSKIKIWPFQKNTLANNTCNVLHLGLSLSLIWYPFLLSFFTPSLRRSRESCIFFKIFSHFSSEALNPKLQSTLFFLQPLLSKSWPFVPDHPNFLIPNSNHLYVLIEILV